MKILIVRPWGKTAFQLGGYCNSAFIEIGHSAEIFTYNDERISSRFSFFSNIEKTFIKKNLLKKISGFRPQLVLVIKGDRIPRETIEAIKNKFQIPIANYWIDDPHYIDVSRTISPYYDCFFTNDPDCVHIHKESGCPHAEFLSFGCFPDLHKRVRLSKNEYRAYASDISFAGTVSEERLNILEMLSDFDLKIWSPRVVSSFGKKYMIKKKRLFLSSLYYKFTGRAVWDEELVKVYNASKIVLNIHSPQTVPIMRDFEVPGCGAFLLTDHARNLDAMFKPGEEIVCYEDAVQLREKVEFYLAHPEERKEIARRGHIRVHADHTYVDRMRELIALIGNNT